jgi:hypothetical protein
MSFVATVSCDYPLPDPEYQKTVFGTADLWPAVGHYHITPNGRLVWQQLDRLFYGFEATLDEVKILDSEELDFHGDFRFHTLMREARIDYRACFRQGTLRQIVREDEPEPRAPNAKELLAWEAETLEQERLLKQRWHLRKLMELEPEIAEKIRNSEFNRTTIAYWFATPHVALDWLTPYRAITLEKRQSVLKLLDKELKRS